MTTENITKQERDERYRQAAKRLHESEGALEIDSNAIVSYGDDPGAYVQAWVWVAAEDAGEGNTD